jgi:hypothetical protein
MVGGRRETVEPWVCGLAELLEQVWALAWVYFSSNSNLHSNATG